MDLLAKHKAVCLGLKMPTLSMLNRLPRLGDYLAPLDELPPYPEATNQRQNVKQPWQVLGNDRQGDCFFAMASHMELLWSSLNGAPQMLSEADTLARYHECTGPGDSGTDPYAGMNFWQQRGMAGKLLGFAKVSMNTVDILKHCIDLFGSLGWGMNLPRAWQGSRSWKGPINRADLIGQWEPGSWSADGNAGHIVPLVDYDSKTFYAVSWGDEIEVSFTAIQDYGMIMLAPIHPFWLKANVSPDNLNLAQLRYDLAVLAGGTLPPKPPGPVTPPPVVPPVPPVTPPPVIPPPAPAVHWDVYENVAASYLRAGKHQVYPGGGGGRGLWT